MIKVCSYLFGLPTILGIVFWFLLKFRNADVGHIRKVSISYSVTLTRTKVYPKIQYTIAHNTILLIFLWQYNLPNLEDLPNPNFIGGMVF